MVFGDSDGIVVDKEITEDLKTMFGRLDDLEIETFPGGRGFPVLSSNEVIKHIDGFWNLNVVAWDIVLEVILPYRLSRVIR